jgi:carotenoid cleavage dioxygenase-like enzyme
MYLSFWKLKSSEIAKKSFYDCYFWDKNKPNKFHIYDRQTGRLETVDSDLSFFFFHTINTYEENKTLIIDLSTYDSNAIIDDFYLSKLSTIGMANAHKATIRRINIDSSLLIPSHVCHLMSANFILPTTHQPFDDQ